MDWKIGITLLCLALGLTIGLGIVEYEKEQKYIDLKYKLYDGEEFKYSILYSDKDKNVTLPIEINVLEATNGIFNVKGTVTLTKNEEKASSIYSIKMTPFGRIVDSKFENLMLPEIQPELPNILPYPEKKIKKGETWFIPFQKKWVSSDNLSEIEYKLYGITKYTFTDTKTISVRGGTFECVGIKSDINATLIMNITNLTKTTYTETTVNASGESWVDLSRGFLVKSNYNMNKLMKVNLSEAYKEMGLENVYREIQMNSRIDDELVKLEGV